MLLILVKRQVAGMFINVYLKLIENIYYIT